MIQVEKEIAESVPVLVPAELIYGMHCEDLSSTPVIHDPCAKENVVWPACDSVDVGVYEGVPTSDGIEGRELLQSSGLIEGCQ